jgi:hypothetical protein
MTDAPTSPAGWIVASRELVLGDGTRVCLAEPGEDGIRALFSMGWTAWTEMLAGIGIGGGCFVFPVPAGALQRAPDGCGTVTELHAAITGDARKPPVLQQGGNGAAGNAVLWVPPSSTCFTGHFPLQPVVPGVVLMGWVVDQIRQRRADAPDILEFRQVKFQRVVTPCGTLRISWTGADGSLVTYVVESSDGINAKGQCVFEGTG